MNKRDDRKINGLFDIGLVLKAAFSVFEIAGGIAAFFASSRIFVQRIADVVTAGELAHDPDDFVATTLRHAAHDFAIHAHYLLAAYLLIRGTVKLVLILLILKGQRVAYPLFIAALGLFASYEAYRAIGTSNILLGGVALFDTCLMLLTAYEYNSRCHSSSG